jgi:hypothetical protein
LIKFLTLGPAGSNHEYVTRRYLAFHGIAARSSVEFVTSFDDGAAMVLAGAADFMVQCAVHPATVSTVAKYLNGLFVVDTFISPSQDLAIILRKDAENPRTLAAMSPTIDYTDASKWEKIQFVETVAAVSKGLVDGTYAAGLGYVSVAEKHPDLLSIIEFIGTVDDAWIVYGRTKVCDGGISAWPQSPAASLFHAMA